ncbi:MAG: hypothetical protein OEZ54_07520 [Gemmatimonadota bacterium]|nr:hypothetical protein [Gemmatimonadota bacterium]
MAYSGAVFYGVRVEQVWEDVTRCRVLASVVFLDVRLFARLGALPGNAGLFLKWE